MEFKSKGGQPTSWPKTDGTRDRKKDWQPLREERRRTKERGERGVKQGVFFGPRTQTRGEIKTRL